MQIIFCPDYDHPVAEGRNPIFYKKDNNNIIPYYFIQNEISKIIIIIFALYAWPG